MKLGKNDKVCTLSDRQCVSVRTRSRLADEGQLRRRGGAIDGDDIIIKEWMPAARLAVESEAVQWSIPTYPHRTPNLFANR